MMRFWFGLAVRGVVVWLVVLLGVRMLAPTLPHQGVISYNAYDGGQTLFSAIEMRDIGRDVTYRPISMTFSLPVSWSPDARQVAYVSPLDSRIRVQDVFTGQETVLVEDDLTPYYVSWSPDGQWLGFLVGDEIWAYNLREQQTYRFHKPGDAAYMGWAPDSTRIVYAARKNVNTDVYEYNIRTREDRLLVHSGEMSFGIYSPAVSPDGCCVAYVLNGGVAFYVMLYDSTTDEKRELFQTASTSSVAWSADGRYLLLSRSVRGEGYHVFRYELATGDMRRITHGPGHFEFPRWVDWS